MVSHSELDLSIADTYMFQAPQQAILHKKGGCAKIAGANTFLRSIRAGREVSGAYTFGRRGTFDAPSGLAGSARTRSGMHGATRDRTGPTSKRARRHAGGERLSQRSRARGLQARPRRDIAVWHFGGAICGSGSTRMLASK